MSSTPTAPLLKTNLLRPPRQLERRAGKPWGGRTDPAARLRDRRECAGGENGDGAAVGEGERPHGFRHGRAAASERLGSRPCLVPLRAARNVERDQQGRPGAEPPDSVGDRAGPAVVADEPGGRFVRPVAAEKRQVDEGRDPEAHVIEPNEDAQPVIGEEAGEQREAEPAEVVRALA